MSIASESKGSAPSVVAEMRSVFESVTGRVPLFLARFKEEYDAAQQDFDKAVTGLSSSPIMCDILQTFRVFSKETAVSGTLNHRSESVLKSLTLKVPANEAVTADDLDHRFIEFHPHGNCATAVCGICSLSRRNHPAAVQRGALFLDSSVFTTMRNTDNPGVRGFLVEQVVLSSLEMPPFPVGTPYTNWIL